MKLKELFARVPPMLLWLVSLYFTSFQVPIAATGVVTFAMTGVALVLFVKFLWRDRTRPAKSAFWFLMHILFLAGLIAFANARPVIGFIVALPVALLWVHDSPATPTAMLIWGFIALLWQPGGWAGIGEEVSFDVLVASMLIIAAAMFERNRLAARQYTQAGFVFSLLRIGLVGALSLLFIVGREGLRAVNAFTYIGIDASGFAGKVTLLGFVFIGISLALLLFRVRPEKAPDLMVTSAAAPRKPLDFDTDKSTNEKIENLTKAGGRMDRERARDAAIASQKPGKAAPGSLDFD